MNKRPFLLWFSTPAVVLAVIYCLALFMILQYSFREFIPGSLNVGPWTLANLNYIARPVFLNVFYDTVVISAWTAGITLLVAYPIAYALVRTRSNLIRATILIIAITPLFTGEIARTYSWIIVLGNNGFINAMLLAMNIIERPLQMMFTTFGVVVVLVHFTLPIMVIILATALSHIEPNYEKAAESLGADPIRAFLTVTLPLSAPGIVAGLMTCFAWTFSAFATPQLIGGGQINMIGNLVYQLGIAGFNYPLAAILSLAGIVLTLVVVAILKLALRPLEKAAAH
ncbi:MAG: ABC transporter permease [Parvibaculaceae bacterium]